jgi:sec-independent protein translocase protein TatA
MSLGFGELLIIILILLVVFGGAKLPQLGDALGRAIRNFKRGASENDKIAVTPKTDKELPKSAKADIEDAKVEKAEPKPKPTA